MDIDMAKLLGVEVAPVDTKALGKQRLREALQEAQPAWSEKTVNVTQNKLAQIGVENAQALAEALKGPINERLRDAGLKAFSQETLNGLREALGVKSRIARGPVCRRWKSRPSPPGAAGEDLEQELPAVDTPSSASNAPPGRTATMAEDPADVDDINGSVSKLRSFSRNELALECDKRGIPVASHMQEEKLPAGLEQALTWESFSQPKLLQVCEKRGLNVAADATRSSLLELLAIDRWEAAGVPIQRLQDPDSAQRVSLQVCQLQQLSLAELVAECKRLKMPARPSMDRKRLLSQKRNELIWRNMATSELVKECQQLGLNPKPNLPREQLLSELIRSTWIEEWEAAGVPARKFGDLRAAEEAWREIGRIKDLSNAELQAECAALSIPLHSALQRHEIQRRLRLHAIWQRQPISELEKECILKGLPSALKGPPATHREQLVSRLVSHACQLTWQALGVPAEHLTLKAALHVADIFDYLEHASESELREKYQANFLDEEMDRSDIVERLKLVVVWQEMPCSALREECGRRGLRPEAAEGEEEDESDERRDLLMGKLLLSERAKRWKLEGIPVDRLHSVEAAAELVERTRVLETLPRDQVLADYLALSLPEEQSLTRSAMVMILKYKATWWALAWPELLIECRRRGINVDGMDCRREDEDELWTQHGVELVQKLLAFEMMNLWEMRGYQVSRVRNFEAASLLVERCEQIAQTRTEDLWQECLALNIPVPEDMERASLERHLRARALWRALSLQELVSECRMRDLEVQDLFDEGPDGGVRSEYWQRTQLTKRLISYECLSAWEEQGFQALRIGSIEDVADLAERSGRLTAMSDEELRAAYAEMGLAKEEAMERQELIQSLKLVMEWEVLPASELRKECLERGISPEGAEGQREVLLQKLLLDLSKSAFAERGVPVGMMPTTQSAARLARRYEQLDSMDPAQLRKDCASLGMNCRVDMAETELRERLRQAALWQEMDAEHLRAEVAKRSAHAAEAMTSPAQLRDALMLNLCAKDFKGTGVPVHRLRSLQAAVSLDFKQKWAKAMNHTQLQLECFEKQMPIASNSTRQDLQDLVLDLALWEALPAEGLMDECTNLGIPHQQLVPSGCTEDEKYTLLRELLLTRACAPALEARMIPEEELTTCAACFRVVKAWDRFGNLFGEHLKEEYRGAGLALDGVSRNTMVDRMRQMSLWKEVSLLTVQKECRKAGINSIAREHQKADLVMKLARALWGEMSYEQQRMREEKERHMREEQQRRQERQQQQSAKGAKPRPGPRDGTVQRPSLALVAPHLRTLGLTPPLNMEEVKKAYKRLALKYHPDKNTGEDKEQTAETFRGIVEAYQFLMEHAKTLPPSQPAGEASDPGDAILAGKFALVGSWSDWQTFVELVADNSGTYSADVPLEVGENVEFQILCDGSWERRLYPSPKGDTVLGPHGEDKAHDVNWRLPPQSVRKTLRVKLRPRARRVEFFTV